MAGRAIAIIVMGVALLLLAGVLRSTAAAQLHLAMPGVSGTVLASLLVALAIGGFAPTVRAAWGRLCLANGIACLLLVVTGVIAMAHPAVGTAELAAQQIEAFGLGRPIGAALGAALVSGMLGLIAVALAAAILIVSFLLLRKPGTHAATAGGRK